LYNLPVDLTEQVAERQCGSSGEGGGLGEKVSALHGIMWQGIY
jgi:hypothetical protein